MKQQPCVAHNLSLTAGSPGWWPVLLLSPNPLQTSAVSPLQRGLSSLTIPGATLLLQLLCSSYFNLPWDPPRAGSDIFGLHHLLFGAFSPLVSMAHSRLNLCQAQNGHLMKNSARLFSTWGQVCPGCVRALWEQQMVKYCRQGREVLLAQCPRVTQACPPLPSPSIRTSLLWSVLWPCLPGRSVLMSMLEAFV